MEKCKNFHGIGSTGFEPETYKWKSWLTNHSAMWIISLFVQYIPHFTHLVELSRMVWLKFRISSNFCQKNCRVSEVAEKGYFQVSQKFIPNHFLTHVVKRYSYKKRVTHFRWPMWIMSTFENLNQCFFLKILFYTILYHSIYFFIIYHLFFMMVRHIALSS
jgi:hypothetical protein